MVPDGSMVEVVSGNESRRGIDMPKFLGSTNINITCITGITFGVICSDAASPDLSQSG